MQLSQELFLQILALLSGSSILVAFVNALFNRRKISAEIETHVVKNYKDIVIDLRDELKRLQERVDQMQAKESLYIEQANLLIKDKSELALRVFQLEKDNKYLHSENQKLKDIIEKYKN